MRPKRGLFLGVLLLSLSFLPSCSQQRSGQSYFGPLSENADWQAQDYEDSRGIKAVHMRNERLALDAHLVGQHANYAKGEVYLDLRYFPGLEGRFETPKGQRPKGVDLSARKITVEVQVPGDFAGWSSAPNGVQIFVKDAEWRGQYGTWRNVEQGGKITLALMPTPSYVSGGYTDDGFDPTRMRIIGVKFAIGSESSHTFDGPLFVNNIKVTPGISLDPPPTLTSSVPSPALAPQDKIELRSDGFYLNGRKWFIVGGNWRGIEYGQNFGVTKWFPSGNGISKHPNFVRVQLDYFRRAGIKVLRVGLLDDGTAILDREGHVTGYNAAFRKDVKTFLDLVAKAGMRVEFTLFDYLVAGKPAEVGGVQVRGRSEVINDEERTQELINRFLGPFLKEFGNHPAIIGFDVINEPEWIVSEKDGGGWETVEAGGPTKADTPVLGKNLNRFVSICATAIRKLTNRKPVSVGVSAKYAPLVQDMNVDYFALHHYPWMGNLTDHLHLLSPGKPWVLEEYPTRHDEKTVSPAAYLDRALSAGSSGALLWNLTPGIDENTSLYRSRNSVLLELRKWVDTHNQVILR